LYFLNVTNVYKSNIEGKKSTKGTLIPTYSLVTRQVWSDQLSRKNYLPHPEDAHNISSDKIFYLAGKAKN